VNKDFIAGWAAADSFEEYKASVADLQTFADTRRAVIAR
jgi:hypothetical protein